MLVLIIIHNGKSDSFFYKVIIINKIIHKIIILIKLKLIV